MKYSKHIQNFISPPQSEPLPGRDQVQNRAGGYVFKITPVEQFKRFLLAGTVGGTYYASESEMTAENIRNIQEIFKTSPYELLDIAEEYSVSGRIPKNDTAILALALGFAHGDVEVRWHAASKFNKIIRIPTHLFTFVEYLKQIRGFGKLVKKTINNWYLSKPFDTLVYHILKYQSRGGWNHVDVWRLTHPVPPDSKYDQLFGWFRNYIYGETERTKAKLLDHPLVKAFIRLREANTKKEVIDIINNYDVSWEFVPTQWLNDHDVLKALLKRFPMHALVRYLNRLTLYEVIKPFSEEESYVVQTLTDEQRIKKARIHPIQVLNAYKTYSSGRGGRGKLEWNPNSRIVDALDQMVELSFVNYEQVNKRFCVAIDVSGSMSWNTAFESLTAAECAACMAIGIVRKEPKTLTLAFKHEIDEIHLTKKTSLKETLQMIKEMNFGATDCALPMLYCLDKKIKVDCFVVLTDNETWYGRIHPVEALNTYRRKINPEARLVVVAMTATNYSIADPEDPKMLDVAGFDPSVPKLVAEFANLS